MSENTHGGARPGAGRPAGSVTRPSKAPEPPPEPKGFDPEVVLSLASQGAPSDVIAGVLELDADAPEHRDEFRRLCELGRWRFKLAKYTRAFQVGIIDARPTVMLSLLAQEPGWNSPNKPAEDYAAVEKLRKIFENYALANTT